MQIRGSQGTLSMSSHGLCTPLEESVLNHLFGHGRLFEFSACLSCSYPHITLIIKNLDRDDTEKRGRIRDNIALLVEGADVRIIALDRDNLLKAKNEAMSSLIASTTAALKDIEQQQHKQLLECDQIFQDLQQTFNMKLITLGLTETQEEDLAQMIQDAAQRALDVYDAGLSTEAYMDRILKQLATQA